MIDLTALDISGAASFEIQELDVDRLEMVLSGAGGVRIDSLTATDLVATISGAGDVDYFGNPAVTQNITGAGSITNRGDK